MAFPGYTVVSELGKGGFATVYLAHADEDGETVAIKQFLTDVEWGALDYLLVDTPPGTSDEHISLVQYLAKALGPDDGALIVSTPQEVPRAIGTQFWRNSAQFL